MGSAPDHREPRTASRPACRERWLRDRRGRCHGHSDGHGVVTSWGHVHCRERRSVKAEHRRSKTDECFVAVMAATDEQGRQRLHLPRTHGAWPRVAQGRPTSRTGVRRHWPSMVASSLSACEGVSHAVAMTAPTGPDWTDHDVSDPGVTLLQVVVYALGSSGPRDSHRRVRPATSKHSFRTPAVAATTPERAPSGFKTTPAQASAITTPRRSRTRGS